MLDLCSIERNNETVRADMENQKYKKAFRIICNLIYKSPLDLSQLSEKWQVADPVPCPFYLTGLSRSELNLWLEKAPES